MRKDFRYQLLAARAPRRDPVKVVLGLPCSTFDVVFDGEEYTQGCMWVVVEGVTESGLGGGP